MGIFDGIGEKDIVSLETLAEATGSERLLIGESGNSEVCLQD